MLSTIVDEARSSPPFGFHALSVNDHAGTTISNSPFSVKLLNVNTYLYVHDNSDSYSNVFIGCISTHHTLICTSLTTKSHVLIHFHSVISNTIEIVSHEFTKVFSKAAQCSGLTSGPVVS
jgi:hypothetical protein